MAGGCGGEDVAVGCLNGLIEIGHDVANIFDSHAQPHQFGSNAGRCLLFIRKLLVSRRQLSDEEQAATGVTAELVRVQARASKIFATSWPISIRPLRQPTATSSPPQPPAMPHDEHRDRIANQDGAG